MIALFHLREERPFTDQVFAIALKCPVVAYAGIRQATLKPFTMRSIVDDTVAVVV